MRSISRIAIATAVACACGYAAAATTTPATTGAGVRLARESADLNSLPVNAAGLAAAGAVRWETSAIGTNQRLTLAPVGTAAFAAASAQTSSFICSAATASAVFEIATGASSSTAIVYDISSASGGSLNGASCGIPSIVFTAASMRTSGNVQITGAITSVNTGATIDSFSATTVASVGTNFTFTAASTFDGVIDVTKSRLTFASGTEQVCYTGVIAAACDRFTLSAAQPSAGARNNVNGTEGDMATASFNLTLTAAPGFQFLQEASTTEGAALNCSADSGSGQATVASSGTVTSGIVLSPASGACTTMTASFTGLANNATFSVALGRSAVNAAASTATAYASNTYTASYSINRASTTLTAANTSASIAAGSWTQNGASSMRLNYVPLSDNTSLQVLISNNSSVAGVAEFVAYSGGATCTGNLGTVAANGVTSIGGALRSALRGTPNSSTTTNCTTSFDDATGNAAVVLSTTTPADNTKIHSGFTVTGDTNPRQILINSTNQ